MSGTISVVIQQKRNEAIIQPVMPCVMLSATACHLLLLTYIGLHMRHWPLFFAAVGLGIAAGVVARIIQGVTLESKVPFTLRKHTLLLPVFAELLLGQFSFSQVLQQPQVRGFASLIITTVATERALAGSCMQLYQ
jgi:hypothetical protein